MTILFDLDGTLIDSTDAILEGFEVAYRAHGESVPSSDTIKSLIGYPLDIMFTKLGCKGNVWSYVDAYKKHYRIISKEKTYLLPKAKDAIELASQFATLGIVTTKTGKYSQELLNHMGIMKYFDVLIGRENVENPKPHSEPIVKAMKSLNSQKNSTWMVGDTILDLKSAKNAEINSVGVTCGYGEKIELQKYTNYVLSSTYLAVKLIESLK